MTGAQIAALVFAILLLLPGGCFLVVGISMASESTQFALVMMIPAAIILGIAGVLFWAAFHRTRPPQPGPPPEVQ